MKIYWLLRGWPGVDSMSTAAWTASAGFAMTSPALGPTIAVTNTRNCAAPTAARAAVTEAVAGRGGRSVPLVRPGSLMSLSGCEGTGISYPGTAAGPVDA